MLDAVIIADLHPCGFRLAGQFCQSWLLLRNTSQYNSFQVSVSFLSLPAPIQGYVTGSHSSRPTVLSLVTEFIRNKVGSDPNHHLYRSQRPALHQHPHLAFYAGLRQSLLLLLQPLIQLLLLLPTLPSALSLL